MEELDPHFMTVNGKSVRRLFAPRPLSTAQAVEVLKRVRLQHPAFPIQMSIFDAESILVRFETRVPSRDEGVPIGVMHATQIPQWLSEANLVAFVHGEVRRVFEHEADECFVYDGERLYDPHPPKWEARYDYRDVGHVIRGGR